MMTLTSVAINYVVVRHVVTSTRNDAVLASPFYTPAFVTSTQNDVAEEQVYRVMTPARLDVNSTCSACRVLVGRGKTTGAGLKCGGGEGGFWCVGEEEGWGGSGKVGRESDGVGNDRTAGCDVCSNKSNKRFSNNCSNIATNAYSNISDKTTVSMSSNNCSNNNNILIHGFGSISSEPFINISCFVSPDILRTLPIKTIDNISIAADWSCNIGCRTTSCVMHSNMYIDVCIVACCCQVYDNRKISYSRTGLTRNMRREYTGVLPSNTVGDCWAPSSAVISIEQPSLSVISECLQIVAMKRATSVRLLHQLSPQLLPAVALNVSPSFALKQLLPVPVQQQFSMAAEQQLSPYSTQQLTIRVASGQYVMSIATTTLSSVSIMQPADVVELSPVGEQRSHHLTATRMLLSVVAQPAASTNKRLQSVVKQRLPSAVAKQRLSLPCVVGCYSHLFVVLGCLLCLLDSLALFSAAQPKRIPIGAMFDADDTADTHSAFRYHVDKHNNQSTSSTSFILDAYEKLIGPCDSVHVIRAGCSTMSIGVFALMGLTNRSTIETVHSLGQIFHMPYVTPGSPGSTFPGSSEARSSTGTGVGGGVGLGVGAGGGEGYTIYLRPMYVQAVLAVVRHLRWSRVHYLYDSDEGLMHVQDLYRLSNYDYRASYVTPSLELDAHRINDVTKAYKTLRLLDARNVGRDKHIILDFTSSDSALQTVLTQVLQVGMHRSDYHYLLGGMSIDDIDLSAFRYGGVNITGFRLVDQRSSAVKGVIKDLRSRGAASQSITDNKLSLKAALTIDAVDVIVRGLTSLFEAEPDLIRNAFRRGQLINNPSSAPQRGIQCRDETVTWTHGPAVLSHLKQVKFTGLTGPIEFDEQGLRTRYNFDVIAMTFDREPTKIGTWNDSVGLWISRDSSKDGQRRARPGNATYIITTVLEAPYMQFKKKQMEDGKPLVGNDRFEGFCAEVARLIAKLVGFDYLLRLVKDGKFGVQDKVTGEWNGMVGELTRWEADLAVAPLTISSQRERYIDFSKPFMNLGISIMIKRPEKQKPGVFSFMDPLASDIWLCIVLSYLGVSIGLFLVSRFSPYEWQVSDREGGSGQTFTNDFTLPNSLWFSLAAFMQQGCDISPRSMSGRLAGSSWWFFTLITISSYTANLAAFLTVERMLTPIKSADDLVKQHEIAYGTLGSGSSRDFFAHSNITVYKEMWRVMSSNPSVMTATVDEGVQKVRALKGKYAFLLESTMNDYHNQKKPCNTMKVGDNLDSKGYGVATPINHPLREAVGLAVLQLIEDGHLSKLHKKWWYEKGECGAEGEGKGAGQNALTLSNVAGIFYILIGGLGLSMFVSLVQFLSKSYAAARRQKQSLREFLQCNSSQALMTSVVSPSSGGPGGGGVGESGPGSERGSTGTTGGGIEKPLISASYGSSADWHAPVSGRNSVPLPASNAYSSEQCVLTPAIRSSAVSLI